jgi:catechol 2,3-dioxygenase-like lactoylglutathione lyase family enzyme
VTRLLHVSVNVEGSLDRSREFYEQVLGLHTIVRPEIPGVAGNWFALHGEEQLHLVDAPVGPPGIQSTGHHFCVAVDDLQGAIAELESRGIEYKRGRQGDVVQIWIVDPAGNTIEFQQEIGQQEIRA